MTLPIVGSLGVGDIRAVMLYIHFDVAPQPDLAARSPSLGSRDSRRPTLFKNILVLTDGSDLAAKAVEQGILFAKEIGAKITVMTVTEPFHVLSLARVNSNTPRSNTRSMPRLMQRNCSKASRPRPVRQVSPPTRSTSSTNRFIKQSSTPPRPDGAT